MQYAELRISGNACDWATSELLWAIHELSITFTYCNLESYQNTTDCAKSSREQFDIPRTPLTDVPRYNFRAEIRYSNSLYCVVIHCENVAVIKHRRNSSRSVACTENRMKGKCDGQHLHLYWLQIKGITMIHKHDIDPRQPQFCLKTTKDVRKVIVGRALLIFTPGPQHCQNPCGISCVNIPKYSEDTSRP